MKKIVSLLLLLSISGIVFSDEKHLATLSYNNMSSLSGILYMFPVNNETATGYSYVFSMPGSTSLYNFYIIWDSDNNRYNPFFEIIDTDANTNIKFKVTNYFFGNNYIAIGMADGLISIVINK